MGSEVGDRSRKGAETGGKVMQFEQEGKEYRISISDYGRQEKKSVFSLFRLASLQEQN